MGIVGIVGIVCIMRIVRVVGPVLLAPGKAVFVVKIDYLVSIVQTVVRLWRCHSRLLLLRLLRRANGCSLELLDGVRWQVVEVMVGKVKVVVGHCCISICQLLLQRASPKGSQCAGGRDASRAFAIY